MEVNKRLNKKGFTLIELLAVIVILAILMTLAITSMSGVISKAKKDTYVTTALQYANSIRFKVINGEYDAPGAGNCIVVSTSLVELESGKNKSSFDKDYNANLSYVAIYNNNDTGYVYYIQMVDTQKNGFVLVEENELTAKKVKTKSTDTFVTKPVQSAEGTYGSLTLTDTLTCGVEAVY